MTYRIEIDAAQLAALSGRSPGVVQTTFLHAAQEIVNKAVDELDGAGSIPVTSGEGDLKRDIKVEPLDVSGARLHTEVGSRLPYAGIIHEGRGEVFPKKPGGFLVWPNRGGKARNFGAFVFARSSAAVAARPFMTNGLEAATPAIRRLFKA